MERFEMDTRLERPAVPARTLVRRTKEKKVLGANFVSIKWHFRAYEGLAEQPLRLPSQSGPQEPYGTPPQV